MKRFRSCEAGSKPARADRLARGAGIAVLCCASLAQAGQVPTPEMRARVRAALADPASFSDRFDAEVWLTDMGSRLGDQVPDQSLKVEILTSVHRAAKRAGLPPEMVLAVIDIESGFDPFAVSRAGAQGLMQVMPFWRRELGRRRLVDIQDNLLMGCTILRYYYDVERGDWMKTLARYNGSVGRRDYPQKVLDRLRTRWFRQ
jgi:soluble lytic murein transglycosylase-like protein